MSIGMSFPENQLASRFSKSVYLSSGLAVTTHKMKPFSFSLCNIVAAFSLKVEEKDNFSRYVSQNSSTYLSPNLLIAFGISSVYPSFGFLVMLLCLLVYHQYLFLFSCNHQLNYIIKCKVLNYICLLYIGKRLYFKYKNSR